MDSRFLAGQIDTYRRSSVAWLELEQLQYEQRTNERSADKGVA